MVRVQLDVAGDVQLRRELLRFGSFAGDARPAFHAISDFLEDEETRQFDTEGRHASRGWLPIKLSTVTRKRRRGQDTRILHATLRLRRSLTQSGTRDGIREVSRRGMRWGTRVPYAQYHQRGTRRGLPRRRPVELTGTARRQAVRILQRYIVTGST